MKKSFITAAALVLAAVFFGTCLSAGIAEAAWPEKNITVIITHGSGGDTDFNARLMCRLLEKKLGVSVVPTNVTGSNGAIAMAQYKDADPDGYTFVMTNTAALTGNEATGLSDYGYDAFEPVSVYGKQSGENIIVPADSPYKTLSDLIEASKKNPNTFETFWAEGFIRAAE
jgi:tripartite-type tricarboxylate transporter receptor subunit TctC